MAAAVTCTGLLYATNHEVAYLFTHAGGAGAATVNLDAAGGVTPDLVTDTVAGSRIGALMRGDIAAGTATYLNQAAARAALGLDTATAAQLQAKVKIEGRGAGSAGAHWHVDGDVTAAPGNLRITVGAANDGTAVVRIKRRYSVGHMQSG